ncbi:flavoprotein [Arthrobacter sp. ISL-69]|uniref:flavoprotein n=1 Tax=Arthrobacter sp. ISL-69 TaxID=2819113 RepID=UPI001BECC56F|nr:flavoprotein [Arthrobacter sp. ISL-69]MBT2536258.1 pantothenate metabolism flavoprotein [Arthrobacter sp. ISL-69]
MNEVEKRPIELRLPRNRLLIAATGSIGAAHLPQWISAIKTWYPEVDVRVVISHSAKKFVSADFLTLISVNPVLGPDWPESATTVPHQDAAQWADTIVVMPATLNCVSKLASGIADSLLLSIVQSAECPVVIAPSLPGQATRNPIVQENIKRLKDSGFFVLGTVTKPAASTGMDSPGAMTSLPTILSEVARVNLKGSAPTPTAERN